jgi:signal transduction histidine kinase
MTSTGKPRILHLEDDELFNVLLSTKLRRAGLDVDLVMVDRPEEFWAVLEQGGVDLVLSDCAIPGYSGLTALRELRHRGHMQPFVFLSGGTPPEGVGEHLASGAADYLIKDDFSGVAATLQRLLSGEAAPVAAAAPAPDASAPAAPDAAASAPRSGWESISGLVAHDLRNSLWQIKGFAELLRDEHTAAMGESGLSTVSHLLEATDDLGRIIGGLIDLADVASAPFAPRVVDLSAAARDVASRLSAAAPDRAVEWRVGDDLQACADPELLGEILDSLLSNALKFTGSRAAALIEMGAAASPGDGMAAFFVRDNGVGFDPAQESRLFVPFQRLHAQGDFPGAGIGLAIVDRIVHRHGGQVWAEGALDAGATFYFTLPSA